MELENLYVCVDEMIELIPLLNTNFIKAKMESDLYISGVENFVENIQLTLESSYKNGAIDNNELEYLSNLIDSLDIKQLRTETNFLKMCNECIENA